jgi:hypothetical protein
MKKGVEKQSNHSNVLKNIGITENNFKFCQVAEIFYGHK